MYLRPGSEEVLNLILKERARKFENEAEFKFINDSECIIMN